MTLAPTVLVAGLHPPPWAPDALSEALDAWMAGADEAITAADGLLCLRSDVLVAGTFDDPAAAALAALSLVRLPSRVTGTVPYKNCAHTMPMVMVGLGTGAMVRREGLPRGPEVGRAWRLVTVAGPGQVLCTQAFASALDAPSGVGLYRAPAAQELAAGYPVHVIADYRD